MIAEWIPPFLAGTLTGIAAMAWVMPYSRYKAMAANRKQSGDTVHRVCEVLEARVSRIDKAVHDMGDTVDKLEEYAETTDDAFAHAKSADDGLNRRLAKLEGYVRTGVRARLEKLEAESPIMGLPDRLTVIEQRIKLIESLQEQSNGQHGTQYASLGNHIVVLKQDMAAYLERLKMCEQEHHKQYQRIDAVRDVCEAIVADKPSIRFPWRVYDSRVCDQTHGIGDAK